jgi:hypothetical protein
MQTVKKGDRIRAKTINDLIRKSEPLKNLMGSGLRNDIPRLTAWAENIGLVDLSIGDVVVIKGQSLSSPENQNNVVLKIGLPAIGDDLNRIVICLDPVPVGQCGRIIVSGMCWALYDGGSGFYGSLQTGSNYLISGSSGSAQILDTSGNYALIRFPVGGDSGSGSGCACLQECYMLSGSD